MAWTINSVKDHLPLVKIKTKDRLLTGEVQGRMLPAAAVVAYQYRNPGLAKSIRWVYNWKTIVDSLNNGQPLPEGGDVMGPVPPKGKKKKAQKKKR